MFRDLWDTRASRALAGQKSCKQRLVDIDKQSDAFLERVVEATSAAVIVAYEKKIEALAKERLLMSEKLDNLAPPSGRFDQMFELALSFLSNPWKIWGSEALYLKRLVLRLAFTAPLAYDRKTGYRMPDLSLPFTLLSWSKTQECEMVRLRRLELPRGLAHSDLNAARLPVPPQPHWRGF